MSADLALRLLLAFADVLYPSTDSAPVTPTQDAQYK